MRGIHFLTFGGSGTWPHAARRLSDQASRTRLFETVTFETADTIFGLYPDFVEHRDFILANPRGWGYWLWKPFLIWRHLQKMRTGEILFYLDAGFEIFPRNRGRLRSLLRFAQEHDVMVMNYADAPIFNVVFWSKQSWLDHASAAYPINRPQFTVPMVSAGCIALKKTDRLVGLIETWYRMAYASNYAYSDDMPSSVIQRQKFFENRHDQPIFSLLLEHYGLPTLPYAMRYDHIASELRTWPALLREPLLAFRNNTGLTQASSRARLRSLWGREIPYPERRGTTRRIADELMHNYAPLLTKLGLASCEDIDALPKWNINLSAFRGLETDSGAAEML